MAISRRVDLQHVGYIQSDCCCCVNMKRIRASVHREARFNIRGCANQSNNDTNDHVIMQMEKSTLIRSRQHQPRCYLKSRGQSATTTTTTTIQQSFCDFWPAKEVSTTMLYVLYLSALYLVIATNACISGANAAAIATAAAAAAATTTTSTTTTAAIATFVATNNLSERNDSQRHGAVYAAALSGTHSNVPTTIDPGEYFIFYIS